MVDVKMEPSWKEVLKDELAAPYFERLTNAVKLEYKTNRCFPEGRNIFRAFDLCPFNDVKVVILGQDPYHEIGQAHGLSFSVQEGIAMPPSLINIFKELKNDIGKELPANGDLTHWAEQGVLLLNSTLTVRAHQAASHQNIGWEPFTDAAIKTLSTRRNHLVFILWGGFARRKKVFIDTTKHLVLESVHPSPLSANRGGWFGNHHFSQANNYLISNGIEPINW